VGPVFHLAIFALAGHAPPESCNAIEGWEAMLQDRDPAIIVIGEMHGNAESPAIFADAVCLSAIAEPVTVAIEQGEENQPAIDAYIASDGGDEARKAFARAPMWRSEFKDGRSSVAMFDLYEQLRQLAEAGRIDRLVAFVPTARGPSEAAEREKALADFVMAHAGKRTLVFTGNVHAMRQPVSWGSRYLPMTAHFPDETTVSLDITGNDGETWACSGQPLECGPMHIDGVNAAVPRSVVIEEDPDAPYSGRLYLGTATTASPPSAPEPREIGFRPRGPP